MQIKFSAVEILWGSFTHKEGVIMIHQQVIKPLNKQGQTKIVFLPG